MGKVGNAVEVLPLTKTDMSVLDHLVDRVFYRIFGGWCYFPSVGTEIKCNDSLFSVHSDGNLYTYIRYFPSVVTEIYS